MDATRRISRRAVAVCLALLGAADIFAVRRTEDPLALVPADAATVGVIHWNELRASPIGAQVLAEMDEVSVDGDASLFLREMGMTPQQDIDTIVLAMSRGSESGRPDDALVLFEGRFDVERIAGALVSRGATRQAGATGSYYRIAGKDGGHGGAVALVNRHLVIAGREAAVLAALARRESGGAGGLMSGQGLGQHLARIQPGASAWALVDLTRFPFSQAREAHIDVHGQADGEPARVIVEAMKSVSLLAFQATVHGDTVDLSAMGLSSDAENRELLEDSLRGILAMWRLAAQEKYPEIVPVLRRVKVENDGESVSITGTLPGSFLKSLSEKRQAGK